MALPIDRTGKTVWVVRVEYGNGNKRYFAFEEEGDAARFRDAVHESATNVRRVQPFEVPIYALTEK